jgi:polar amino acid transport system substrate-binding protein
VAVEFVPYDQAGKLAEGVRADAWDIAFLGNEPQRANEIAFSGAYLEIEATYLVPAGSPIRSAAEVDRPGVRIAVADKAAYDLYLVRNLKHAELVRAEGIDGSYALFVDKKLDVLAGLKPRLVTDVEKLPGSRILDGRFMAVQQSIGCPKGREAAARYLRELVEDLKASGFVGRAIETHGVRGVSVAASTPAQ